ncbi:hypothetical protein ASE99_14090 [Serratia sp. Leaf51]|nr:hypothetical protein ASE99_14090 [Serratia sp. Leaf51]
MNRNVNIALLASKNVAILLVDTCLLLDVIRDVTRDSVFMNDITAGLHILSKAEVGNEVFILMAQQVEVELKDNESLVEDSSVGILERFINRVNKVDDISSKYGSTNKISTTHLTDHVSRTKVVLERWKKIVYLVPQKKGIVDKAFARVGQNIAPAKKGKDSMKDCVVTETYLDVARELRNAGLTAPIVFASSNTKDYCEANNLAQGLVNDFKLYNITFSPNFGGAKHFLGI